MNTSDCWPTAYKAVADGDDKKAMEICSGELCAGVLECQKYLGLMYYKQDDMQQAAQWYSKAIEQGDTDALYGIASVRYAQGEFDEAFRYLTDASKKGNTRALHWLGFMYHKGYGVNKNLDAAADFYRQSAKHGYLVAEHALIRLAFQKRNLFQILKIVPKQISLIFRAAVMGHKNVNDERFSDFLTLGKLINSPQSRSKGVSIKVGTPRNLSEK